MKSYYHNMSDTTLLNYYTNPEFPGSFSSFNKFYLSLRKNTELKVSRNDVKKFLNSQTTYTKFRDRRNRFAREKTKVQGPLVEIQSDISYLQKFAPYNSNYAYLLVFIDCFTRYLFAYPLKTRKAIETSEKLRDLLQRLHNTPSMIVVDGGSEYLSTFKQTCDENQINLVIASSAFNHATQAERVQRTLKQKIFRFMHQNNTKRYITALPQIVKSYNNTVNRATGFAPIDSFQAPAIIRIFTKLYKEHPKKGSKFRFKVGDTVRLDMFDRGLGSKGYTANFSQDVYKIVKVHHIDPPMYTVENLDTRTVLPHRYYEQEMVPYTINTSDV